MNLEKDGSNGDTEVLEVESRIRILTAQAGRPITVPSGFVEDVVDDWHSSRIPNSQSL